MPPLTDRTERWAEKKAATAELFDAALDARPSERQACIDRVVVDHLELADALARRYSRPGSQHEFDDLRQVARVGLIKASHRYESGKGGDFVAFAVPTITGEIKRHLRDVGWVVRPPRSVQELWARTNALVPRLAQSLGRMPSVGELSEALGEKAADVEQALAAHNSLRPTSLDAPAADDADISLGVSIGVDDERFERIDTLQVLSWALGALAERERRILYLRFFEEKTQAEIAEQIGITQMHVSRLLGRSLALLRTLLSELPASAPDGVRVAVLDAAAVPSAA
ncbi:hypothetical protein C5B96_03395 [Subtercola sp. Z020]|uniref:sigma-70 family RNA polymerase sigma factor n=1 Tax=Subtercola sp. Z020 TaxID=2080582 RepID=UPI000CE8F17B|nr:sigma-70 family RNA polymerase sigma factor [Subtercola sp. Z020]PPF87842.1 hypothetical protein C5B96_03395 [Subtercola sp. Z020]